MLNFLKEMIRGNRPDIEAILQDGAVVIDVRTPEEFKKGHVKGAVNIPLNVLSKKLQKIRKYDKPIITCCASGARSGVAAQQLKRAGIEAYNGGPWQNVASGF